MRSPATALLVTLCVFLSLPSSSLSCLGDGCTWDNEVKRFFWCGSRVGRELDVINSVGVGTGERYCTQIGMFVTVGAGAVATPDLVSRGKAKCGGGQQVICHSDVSS